MNSKSSAKRFSGPSAKVIVALILIVPLLMATYGLLADPERELTALASGRFHQVAHKGSGEAIIYRLSSGRLELRLKDFQTYPGVDLEVRLIAAADAFENETVEKSDFISLGALKGTDKQAYFLPDDIDLTRFGAVTIWSRKYRVNYTTAPLRPL